MNGYRRVGLRRAARYRRNRVYCLIHGEPVLVLGVRQWGKNALVTLETGREVVLDWRHPVYAKKAA